MYPKEFLRNKVCEHKNKCIPRFLYIFHLFIIFLLSKTLKFIKGKGVEMGCGEGNNLVIIIFSFKARTNKKKNKTEVKSKKVDENSRPYGGARHLEMEDHRASRYSRVIMNVKLSLKHYESTKLILSE